VGDPLPLVSVAMPYRDRRAQLLLALRTIAASPLRACAEVVVVDDASEDAERVEDLAGEHFGLRVVVRRIDPARRRHHNSVVAWNLAAALCTGKKLLLQNAECLHLDDLLSAAADVRPGQYFSFGCYSLTQPTTEQLWKLDGEGEDLRRRVRKTIGPLRQVGATAPHQGAWYNHSLHRPVLYPFAAAIDREYFVEMGGFDLRFAGGSAWDDVDFVDRLKNRRTEIRLLDSPTAAHQWHSHRNFGPEDKNRAMALVTRSRGEWVANGGRLTSAEFGLDYLC
jgi:hypothetical protein